jgi:hypothetical protein
VPAPNFLNRLTKQEVFKMAGSADPTYNPDMQRLPIPDNDVDAQPMPNIDWAAPVPGELNPLADALTGESMSPGQPFIRVVSNEGQADVRDGTA